MKTREQLIAILIMAKFPQEVRDEIGAAADAYLAWVDSL